MLNRRMLLVLACATAALAPVAVQAQSWRAKYPELTFGAIPTENPTVTTERYSKLADYLSRELGVKVNFRIANDYAAVIEAQRAGNIQIAYYGPASYARAVMTGVETEPVVLARRNNGAIGYNSVLLVRADSPYRSVEDLKGKTLALVDPNSASGNSAPRFFLDKKGVKVDSHFGKTFFAGSHENAVLALMQGTADVAANAWYADTDNHILRMASKGMLKDASGKALKADDFRVVFKSDIIPGDPYAVLKSLPEDLKQAIKRAMLDMPKKDKANFDALSDGKDIEFVTTSAKDYEPIIDMLKFNDRARKAG
ncbi:phosphonate ABC transporter substrate-binding protein [Methylobacterium sp. Leaf87]|uniref:phosphonate ABC transporter substrate-binding protein n=1 Tax=Methylobacterium sp. Leaf87 TaxID=1736243 RepID=UPI0006F284CC|nr:phosphonate ABC transporter substrate-binding protein [Methylobacterium sp. Leaf87]KQO59028.1 phosphonate ABC transporter substrate-binding protein [Methylobacterium sp. Leaf87]